METTKLGQAGNLWKPKFFCIKCSGKKVNIYGTSTYFTTDSQIFLIIALFSVFEKSFHAFQNKLF